MNCAEKAITSTFIPDRWRFVEDSGYPGTLNMARDAALALSAGESSMPTLRVYRFSPACITVGRFQRIDDGINAKKCESSGVDLARRPTGGLAILHKNDFTYSIAIPRMSVQENPAGERDLYFHLIAKGILKSLELIGIHAEVVKHKENRKHSAWCFEGARGVDIKYGERKICGSAQRIYEKSVLQHGSLFLDLDRDLYMDLTGTDEESYDSHRHSVVSLREAGKRDYSWHELSEAFEKGFSNALGVRFSRAEFTDNEKIKADCLLKRRYGTVAWNKGNSL
ncbi:MAG: lipoate--protein ligase family protein [Actinobacteria bacterium]|nr:lipoate--protein ligase family protein [Actinomycetota bacterium]